MSLLLWFNNLMGFFFGVLFLVGIAPYALSYFKLDEYEEPGSYSAFKKDMNMNVSISVILGWDNKKKRNIDAK
jgi:hypothetical protein